MITEIILAGTGALTGGAVAFFSAKKIHNASIDIHTEQAKAKAKVIEHEAEMVLQESKIKAKEAELVAKSKFEDKEQKLHGEFDKKFEQVSLKDKELNNMFKEELKSIMDEKEEAKKQKKEVIKFQEEVKKLEKDFQQKIGEADTLIERASGMTKNEATDVVLKRAEDSARAEIAHIVRKHEKDAQDQAKKRANYILAQATTRFAGDYSAERLINTVNLPSDELKGRIIGKEGRNIKALEMLLGVDIIIDDTPNVIILSSFNLYRRAVATRVIEELVADGRIQPARIEEIYEKVKGEFEQKLLEEGEEIVIDLGITDMHPELVKLLGKLKFRTSYAQNVLQHSIEVAYIAAAIAGELNLNVKLAKRCGLFHDIGKALDHELEGGHPAIGAEVARRCGERKEVENSIPPLQETIIDIEMTTI
jgi:ribonuclease Y